MKTKYKTTLIVIISLAIGFILGMEYKAYQVRSALMDGLSEIENAFNGNEF